ncbi:MAG: DUF4139 domain-containing protein [Bradymonadales bacterium]|nr:DUF4139 domain-containing protein [Bradymonadales bacterium]
MAARKQKTSRQFGGGLPNLVDRVHLETDSQRLEARYFQEFTMSTRIPVTITICLLVALSACQPTSRQANRQESHAGQVLSASDLPIGRVVLYRSGIAYVERHGEIDSDTLQLQIRPDQINDILTTLTVIVDGGENVASSIGLPIERTVASSLDLLPPQVREQGGILALLTAFRGAMATIRTNTDRVSGRIVGTEALPNDEGNQIRRVTLMTDAGELRQLRVDQIQEVRIQNEALEVGLAKSLDVSLGEGDWKPVELTIRLSGEPPHEVAISYVVAMPTWKPTYRILVEEEDLYLQGWAVIDNVSGEEWNDVTLSLVTGTPISFTYDLHSPRFVSRPDLTSRGFTDELAMLAPQVDAGVRTSATAAPRPAAGPTGSSRADRERAASRSGLMGYSEMEEAMPPEEVWAAPPPAIDGQMMVNSLSATVTTEQLGSLFRYDVGYPISVNDRGSALVTLLNSRIEGEDVLYFDPSSGSPQAANHPYRAVHLTNSTEFTVERGPLSIYKGGTFVGQAISPQIAVGERIFLPYSLDGRVRLDMRQSTGEQGVRLVRITNGIIYSEVQNVRQRTYQITNNTGEEARLYIRLPKQTNWSLRTPPPTTEGLIDQGSIWFIPVDLSADPSREFTIEEVTTTTRQVSLWTDLAAQTLGLYISDPDANPEIAEQLQQVLEQRFRIGEIQQELGRQRSRREDIYRRMSEVRQNIEALGEARQSRQLRRELEERLGDLERQVTEMTVQIVSLEEEESELRARISTALMDLTLEPAAPAAP